jgi:tetratricopeptide (TPR) repeat protein
LASIDLNVNKDNILLHNLALAFRDIKKAESLPRALEIFLKSESLEDILNPEIINNNFQGNYYGNIGKCLWFMSRPDDAILCYRKSALLLMEEQNSMTKMNLGWAHLWISEILELKGDFSAAYFFP